MKDATREARRLHQRGVRPPHGDDRPGAGSPKAARACDRRASRLELLLAQRRENLDAVAIPTHAAIAAARDNESEQRDKAAEDGSGDEKRQRRRLELLVHG